MLTASENKTRLLGELGSRVFDSRRHLNLADHTLVKWLRRRRCNQPSKVAWHLQGADISHSAQAGRARDLCILVRESKQGLIDWHLSKTKK
jgi:hypothetical protein